MTDNTEIGAAQADADQPEVSGAPRLAMADLPALLRDAALRLNWSELMPVQTQTIPYMLAGQDVMVQSQTGSGKTGAFLLPILNRIEIGLGAPQALVLVPTRELAVQVTRDAEELGRECGVRPVSIYGGVGYKAQIQGLEDGAQLVIGTPGRILDHLLKGNLNLDRLKVLIFDEADRMLSMGFYPDMKQLQRYLPRGLQSAMFSATYPGHVKRLAQQFLKDPIFVSLSQDQVHVSDVLHVVYKVPAMQKSRILVKIIEQENPASAIIFCNTKADVHFVSVVLRRFGYDVGEISADLTQAAREEVLEKLRLNKLKFLVATDVAARGIDIHELSHVFQYQPPQDHEAYVHRTGRTGRAGAAGVAISFVSGMEEIELEQIAKKFSIPMVERAVPADEELETLISQRAVFLLEARLRKADNIQKERMQRFVRTVGELAANEDSRALLAMLIDEFYQGTFHAPLEQPSGRLIEPVRPARPAPVESFSTQEAGSAGSAEGRPEGEKRRRKRSRKKPAGSVESGTQDHRTEPLANAVAGPATPAVPDAEQPAPVQTAEPARPEPVRQEAVRPEPRAPRPPKTAPRVEPETATPNPEEPAAEPALSDDTAGEATGEGQAPAAPKKRRRRRPRKSAGARSESGEAVIQGEVPAAPASPAPAPKPDRREPRPKSSEAPAAKPARTRETPKPDGRKPAEAPAEPPKPRKKIFLE
jgi:ATP-dependent RNA helicase DeaD